MFHVRYVAWLALACATFPQAIRAEPNDKKDPLLGTWRVVSVHVNGERIEGLDADEGAVGDEVTLEQGKVIGLWSVNKSYASILRRPDKSHPERFERLLESEFEDDKPSLWRVGIDKIEGDTLTWCEACPNRPVPKELKTTEGDERTLLVMKRIKPDAKAADAAPKK